MTEISPQVQDFFKLLQKEKAKKPRFEAIR